MSADVSRRTFLATSAAGVGMASAGTASAMPPNDTATIPLRPLGKTGVMVSVLGFGCGSQYLLTKDPGEAEQIIHRAIELGVSYFDTAYAYGDGESHKRLGKYLVPKYRNQIFLASKLQARDAETAKRNLDETLRDLNTDHLDILHFHNIQKKEDVDQILAKDGALKVYQDAKAQGIIRFIGLTGHVDGDVLVDAMKRIQPDAMQCPQNGAREMGFTERTMPYALAHGIGCLGMKATGRNALLKKNVTPEELVRYSMSLPVATMVIGMRAVEVLESCVSIAKTLKPMPQSERDSINQRLAMAAEDGTLPYLAAGYQDDGRCA